MKTIIEGVIAFIIGGILGFIVGSFLLSTYTYYTAKLNDNDCMITYVRSGVGRGCVYEFQSGLTHIDTDCNLPIKKIGYAEGCFEYVGGTINVPNTVYCHVVQTLENSPFKRR